MKIGIYPGSFDPITYGHINIIERASKITDKLIVAILNNNAKTALFNVDDRTQMIKESLKHLTNVEVKSFNGLLIDFAKKEGATLIFRGLRAVSDYEYEMQLAHTNKALYPDIETIFLQSDTKHSYLSSSIVKEVASYGGDISEFVPKHVEDRMKMCYNKGASNK